MSEQPADKTAPVADGRRLGRSAQIWGIGHIVLALGLIAFTVIGGAEVNGWLLSGLIVAAAGGGLYLLAGSALISGDRVGRGRMIIATLLSLNWLTLFSFLALVNVVMNPDEVIGDGIATIIVGFVLPALHLIGNIWNLTRAINLQTDDWQPA